MALVNFDESNPPYMVLSPSTFVDIASSTNFFYFQNLLASQRITKTSDTRITFQESGVYELNFGAYIGVSSPTAGFSLFLQYGINGAWVTITSGSSTGFLTVQESRHSVIFSVNANDYLELRSVISVPVNQNITRPSTGLANATSTIKRIH